MIAIVDYGVGNLFSLSSSLRTLGVEAEVTRDPGRLRAAGRIILPGVGAFGDAAKKLAEAGLPQVIQAEAARKPLLGICLGMQLLFDKSFEYGEHPGLGLVPGQVVSLRESLEGMEPEWTIDLGVATLQAPAVSASELAQAALDAFAAAGEKSGIICEVVAGEEGAVLW